MNNDTNNKICYSSYLGDKDNQCYEELLTSLLKDSEFCEILNELKTKENIFIDFIEMSEDKKFEYLIKCYFIS